MNKTKLRIGVLLGGKSIEREVSFNSGRTVCDHLDTQRYKIIPIFQDYTGELFILPWHFLYRGKIVDFRHRLKGEAKKIKWDDLKNLIDFVYIAAHGRFAEDGRLQGFLEVLGIPYLGSKVFASAIGINKVMQKKFLRAEGINVPNGISLTSYQINNLEKEKIFKKLEAINLHPPYVVKPCSEGSSFGVKIIETKKDLIDAVKRASTVTPGIKQSVLIEEKIEGMEFTCITITDNKTGKILPLPPTEVAIESGTKLFDYQQKYMPGRAHEFTPARCSEQTTKKIQNLCTRVAKLFGMSNTTRTDGFVTKDGSIIIVDPNTLTGMAPSSFFFREAAHIGMSHTDLINHLIETELRYYGISKKLVTEKSGTKKMNVKKIRVAVLLGGNTNEKEISLESGRNIIYKLSPQKYEPIPIFVNQNMELFKINQQQLVLNSTAEIESSLTPESKSNWNDLPSAADFVFIGLHGGAGENGAVQGTLEMLGLPYNGSSVLASSLCANKFKTNNFLKNQGFDTPKSLLFCKKEWEKNKKELFRQAEKTINFPLIIKPHDDGCSMLVQKIKEKKQLEQSVDNYFKTSGKEFLMVEQMVKGMELTVGVIGNEKAKALPPSQAVATDGILSIEEKFLPGAGENQTPAPLSAQATKFVQKTLETAYETLNCAGYVRIDCFYQTPKESQTGQQRLIILEINTLPGMTPATCIFHQAAEIDLKPMDFIDLVVQLGLKKHGTLSTKNQESPLALYRLTKAPTHIQ